VAALVVGGSLAAARPVLAQDGAPAPADAAQEAEKIPTTAWLLPFIDLTKWEPVTWTLAICSVIACTLIIQGFMRVRRAVLLPPESNQRIEQLILGRQYRELLEFTATDESFVSKSLHPALKRAPNINDMREALETGVAEQTSEQFRRLDYISLLANIGPLLGLLGTVIGIMEAFLAMRRAGGAAEVGALAAGISTALGTTLVGLCLAVPCLAFYTILRNKADRLTQEGAELAEDYFQMMKNEGRESRAASAAVATLAAGAGGQPASRPAARPVAPTGMPATAQSRSTEVSQPPAVPAQ
jgi:biopolymer transport protein ExbB